MAISGRIRVNFPYFLPFFSKNTLSGGFFMSVVSKKFSASLYSMLVLLLLCLVTAFSSGCGNKASLDPAKPVTLTIWHVYGNQTNSPFNDTIMTTRQTGGLTTGYKPLILASASRRWLSLCSSHIALFSFAAPVRGVLNTSYP